MTKSLGGCWDCKELNLAEIDNAHCGIDVSIKAFSSIPSNCPVQKNYIKNIDICNIQFFSIKFLKIFYKYSWLDNYGIDDYIWTCHKLGYGELLFHSKSLPEVLEFIQNYKEDN